MTGRFGALYRRSRTQRAGLAHNLRIGAAVLLMVAGFALVFTPVPGILIMLAGATVLATQSRSAARALDGMELRLRRWLARLRAAVAKQQRTN